MKVFISSTYQDLKEHRKKVFEAIERLKHNGSEIDWLGMEGFGAQSDDPQKTCLKFVDKCDLYIGFFGIRYGHIDKKTGLSMTELEYHRAVEKKKHCLIFLLNSDADVKQIYLDDDSKSQAKLRKFKDKLKKERTIDYFTTPDDLALKVVTALPIQSKIVSSVSNIRPLIPLPPSPYFVYPYPLQVNFTGRMDERKILSEWLTKGERQTPSVYVIEAMGGMGKSALSWYWLKEEILSQGISAWSLLGVFWWSFYDERDFGNFLKRALEYASEGKLDFSFFQSDREILDAIIYFMQKKRMLFVFDGFERVLRGYARMDAVYRGDEVEEDPAMNYRACTDPNVSLFLRQIASVGCLSKLLITSRLFPRELDEIEGVKKLELKGMDPIDAVKFFEGQEIRGTHTEIENACKVYGFHPLSLRLLAGILLKDPRYKKDITNAPKINILKEKAELKILEFSYNSLSKKLQQFISKIAAFRNSLKWEAISEIFKKDFISENRLSFSLIGLIERGIIMFDKQNETYDLHPIVRSYCYNRLINPLKTHSRIITYYEKFDTSHKFQCLTELQPVIELFHHSISSGRFDEAFKLFKTQLYQYLYFQFGEYRLCIEHSLVLLKYINERPFSKKIDIDRAWLMNLLANSYSLTGQPRLALPLYLDSIKIDEKHNNYDNIWISLSNAVNFAQFHLGQLYKAIINMNKSIKISHYVDEEAACYVDRALLYVYLDEYINVKDDINRAMPILDIDNLQYICRAWGCQSIYYLLHDNGKRALECANIAYKFAMEIAHKRYPIEREFIISNWLLGASHCIIGNYIDAENYLTKALLSCRKIGMIVNEATILLEFAKLRLKQMKVNCKTPEKNRLLKESFDCVIEALLIAERCEYRLQLAEIQNFLAEWWQEASKMKDYDKENAMIKAREHAQKAKDYAYCDGPPYYYKVAYEKAEKFLKDHPL